MWVWRRLRSATLCRASLRCGGARGAVWGRKLARSSQNGWRMALYLEGKKGVSQGLAGVRKAARENKEMKFTALLHHLTVDLLRESFYSLKRKAAPGVDGVTWQEY